MEIDKAQHNFAWTYNERALEKSEKYLYVYTCHITERELCQLELDSLFGQPPQHDHLYMANRRIEPGQSAFIRLRLEVLACSSEWEDICEYARQLGLPEGETFKVHCLKESDMPLDYSERRHLERQLGMLIQGSARMKNPDCTLGLTYVEGKWVLGICEESDRSWLERRHKPYNYSTGLPMVAVRALINIALPDAEGRTLIDPCCGMGNVLIEALHMGIRAQGGDMNPLAIQGARVNLKHYGYGEEYVTLGDMNHITARYDAAVLDMPYNLCSVQSVTEREDMLASLRRMTDRAIVISMESIKESLEQAGWMVMDTARLYKGEKSSMVRMIYVCEARRQPS
ncbi:TRM11 family SAM-dependent methyltransferase [Paenibacillus massiliensis]|uniref:TRM11 family SAM-dependent methyltransferase n=1 Tax=Paenibacillus massiliensis TaxID=225917 RepID=UPI000470C702|nr:RNA methyltransferase [Paenibacillus massiliensis]